MRSSIVVRQSMDEMEKAPGFFEIDLVAHCGHSLKGEHAWTLTATDVYLGWTVNIAIRNRAHTRVVAAIEEVTRPAAVPDGRAGLRQRRRVHQPRPDRLVRRADDLHDPREGAHLLRL